MTHLLRHSVDLLIRLFALGLFINIVLSWLNIPSLRGLQQVLDEFYGLFMAPIRRHIRPFRISPSAPVSLDPAPLILLVVVWWLIHPFLMWVLS